MMLQYCRKYLQTKYPTNSFKIPQKLSNLYSKREPIQLENT